MEDSELGSELLRGYVESRSEAAFAELVQRHLNMVYFAALRRTGGNRPLAEDVTQQVFSAIAQKAAALAGHRSLTGWLYTTTRYIAAKSMRTWFCEGSNSIGPTFAWPRSAIGKAVLRTRNLVTQTSGGGRGV